MMDRLPRLLAIYFIISRMTLKTSAIGRIKHIIFCRNRIFCTFAAESNIKSFIQPKDCLQQKYIFDLLSLFDVLHAYIVYHLVMRF